MKQTSALGCLGVDVGDVNPLATGHFFVFKMFCFYFYFHQKLFLSKICQQKKFKKIVNNYFLGEKIIFVEKKLLFCF